MSTLSIMPQNLMTRLMAAVPGQLEKYGETDSWAEEFSVGSRWELPTMIEPDLPKKSPFEGILKVPEDGNLKDIENAIALHKALHMLTPVQARDPRLWVRLTHVEFWAYMRARWPGEKHLPDRNKAARYIHEHYFVPRMEGRALLHNGIARLWWCAYMTHDSARDNPYELTHVMLGALDITKNMLERSMGRSRIVLISFLDFLLANPELTQPGDAARAKVRILARSLNVLGGAAVLDCLTAEFIKNYLAKDLEKINAVAAV